MNYCYMIIEDLNFSDCEFKVSKFFELENLISSSFFYHYLFVQKDIFELGNLDISELGELSLLYDNCGLLLN